MSHPTDEEELPSLQEIPALYLVRSAVEDARSLPAGWIPLLPWPVDLLQEGSWTGGWAALAGRLSLASPAQPVALECVHGSKRGQLHTRSVRHLLEEAPPQWDRVAALVLERVEARSLWEGRDSAGPFRGAVSSSLDGCSALWPVELINRWAEWISVLPDGVVPLAWVQMEGLTPAQALHLAVADLPAGLLLALEGAPHLLSPDLEWTVLGVEQATYRGWLAPDGKAIQPCPQEDRSCSQVGMVLPPDRIRTLQDCEELLRALEVCRERGWAVRLLKEEQIHHSWHGLEALIVLGDRLSSKGRRQCAGFSAAGGTLLWLRESAGLEQAAPFDSCLKFLPLE